MGETQPTATETGHANIDHGENTTSRHLKAMLDVSRALATITDRNRLIHVIVRLVTRTFGNDRTTLFLHDPDHAQLWSRVAQGLEPGGREIRISDKQGLAGHVFTTRTELRIEDTFTHPQFDRATAEDTGYVPRSMVIAPVMHRPDHCDGVLQVLDQRLGFFTEADLDLVNGIATQIAISLENARLIESQRRQFYSFVRALSTTLDARDPSTAEHSVNVANFAMAIAYHLGLPYQEQEYLRIAGLLHDVGKIGTPEAILTKPGKLTDEEYAEMKRHAAHSRSILEQIEFTDEYKDIPFIAPAHHEKLDGSGYPDGLKAGALPLRARIMVVADIAHALMQDRYYRPGMSREKAVSVLKSMTPHQLDERCVEAIRIFLGVSADETEKDE